MKTEYLKQQSSLRDLQKLIDNGEIDFEEIEEKIGIKFLLKQFPNFPDNPPIEFRSNAVLLRDKIKKLVDEYHLIFPFSEDNLELASYRLTVGNEYALGGKIYKIPYNSTHIKIPPFEVAIIKIREILNIPPWLIGRWNIKVKQAYKGLIWVGGPQVDPAWLGHLYCPIYNLSSKDVILNLGSTLAIIDFVCTTQWDNTQEQKEAIQKIRRKLIQNPREIKYYNNKLGQELKSGLVTEVQNRLDTIENSVNNIQGYIGTIFAVIAILVTCLGVLVTQPSNNSTKLSISSYSFISLLLSSTAFFVVIIDSFLHKKSLFKNFLMIILIIFISSFLILLFEEYLYG